MNNKYLDRMAQVEAHLVKAVEFMGDQGESGRQNNREIEHLVKSHSYKNTNRVDFLLYHYIQPISLTSPVVRSMDRVANKRRKK
jgi:hypothetical protein